MWKLRIDYGKNYWLETLPGKVTLATKMPDLRLPYSILHVVAHTIHLAATLEDNIDKRIDRVAGALGGRGFEKTLLSRLSIVYKASVDENFRIDMDWLILEYREGRIHMKIDREKARAALTGIGSFKWPMGVPWPALIPKTREGELRALIHTFCDTPWMRDMVEARKFLGLGAVDKGLIRRVEERIGCSVELASWGINARKYKSSEVCPLTPAILAVLPFIHYALYPPHNLLVFAEDPALHLNTETMEALADMLVALTRKGAGIVLWGEGAERLYKMMQERGAECILA